MKKILAVLFIMLLTLSTADAVIHDWNAGGWYSPTGNSLPGLAINVSQNAGGYNISCYSTVGTCYLISGSDLTIWDDPFGGSGTPTWINRY